MPQLSLYQLTTCSHDEFGERTAQAHQACGIVCEDSKRKINFYWELIRHRVANSVHTSYSCSRRGWSPVSILCLKRKLRYYRYSRMSSPPVRVKHGTQQGSFGNLISPNIIEPGLTSSQQLRIHLGISDPYIYNYIYRSVSPLSVSDTDTDTELGHGGTEDGPHNYGTLGPRTSDQRNFGIFPSQVSIGDIKPKHL